MGVSRTQCVSAYSLVCLAKALCRLASCSSRAAWMAAASTSAAAEGAASGACLTLRRLLDGSSEGGVAVDRIMNFIVNKRDDRPVCPWGVSGVEAMAIVIELYSYADSHKSGLSETARKCSTGGSGV